MDREGTIDGRYALEERIGEGGMAAVYRARDTQLGRTVAVKLLQAVAACSEANRERFRREAHAVARLSHPNIVAIHDAGEDGARMYIVMELVEGRSLDAALRGARPPLRRLVEILEKVARGAHHAHAAGIVHRDLKPGNVLLDAAGEPKIVDFGLAQFEAEAVRLTRSGTAVGTPLYMAPEQVAGRHADITARTDVYAIGAMLYEALAGRPAFGGKTTAEVFSRIVREEPEPLPGAPVDLSIVALKALEKDPGRRYPSALAMAEDLRRWLDGEPIAARPPSALRRMSRLSRHRGVLAGAAALAGVAGALAFLLPVWRAESASAEARRRQLEVERSREEGVKELGTLWARIAMARERMRQAFRKPAEIRADLERTVAEVTDFIGRRRDWPEAYCVRARALRTLGDTEGARRDAEAATGIDGAFAPAWALLGQLRLEEYTRVLTADGAKRAEPLLGAAEEALRRGASGASWGLARVPEDDVHDTVARALRLAYVDHRGGEAGEVLRRAHAAAPSEEYCLWLAAWSRDPAEKMAWLDRAIAVAPHSEAAHYRRGNARSDARDWKEAIADYTKAIDIDPRSAETHCNRGLARDRSGDLEGAIGDHTRAIELNPRLANAWGNRGLARMSRKEYDDAIADLTKALEIEPDRATAYAPRAFCREMKGDRAGAIADYERALEVAPPGWALRPMIEKSLAALRGN